MSKEDLRKFLESHFHIEKKITALEQEVGKLHCSCYDTADDEAEILEEIENLRAKQKAVRLAISKLENPDLEAVMIMRYINHYTESETADALHYAHRTVQEKVRKGIKKLSEII